MTDDEPTPNADALEAELARRAGIVQRAVDLPPYERMVVAVDLHLHSFLNDTDPDLMEDAVRLVSQLLTLSHREVSDAKGHDVAPHGWALIYGHAVADNLIRHHQVITAMGEPITVAQASNEFINLMVQHPDRYFQLVARRAARITPPEAST